MQTRAQPPAPYFNGRSEPSLTSHGGRRCSSIPEEEEREDTDSAYEPDELIDLSSPWDPTSPAISTGAERTDVVLHFPGYFAELKTTGSLRATLSNATDEQAAEITTKGLDPSRYNAQNVTIEQPEDENTGSSARLINVIDDLADAIPPNANAACTSDNEEHHGRGISPSQRDREGWEKGTFDEHRQDPPNYIPDEATRAACPKGHGIGYTCRTCYKPTEPSVTAATSEDTRTGTGTSAAPINWSSYVVPVTLTALALGGTALYLAYGGTSQADEEACASVLDPPYDIAGLDEETDLPSSAPSVQSWLRDKASALRRYTWGSKSELFRGT